MLPPSLARRRNDDAKLMADTPPLSLRYFSFFCRRTKRTVRFPCPFSNCCRSLSLPFLPRRRSHREWMRGVSERVSVCGEAADCTASFSPFLLICWRASVRARKGGRMAVPFFPLGALARLLSRPSPRRSTRSLARFSHGRLLAASLPIHPFFEVGTIPYDVSV